MNVEFFVPLATRERIRALGEYDLGNQTLAAQLDELCARTATSLGAPMSMVSIVLDSAQSFVGSHGVTGWIAEAAGTPAEWAFCAHAVVAAEPLYVVEDAGSHPAHANSPLVTQESQRAYAGATIYAPDGQILGMHCVVDTAPHAFTAAELAQLSDAARQASTILETFRHAPSVG